MMSKDLTLALKLIPGIKICGTVCIHQCQGNLPNPPKKIRAVRIYLDIQWRRMNFLSLQLHYGSLAAAQLQLSTFARVQCKAVWCPQRACEGMEVRSSAPGQSWYLALICSFKVALFCWEGSLQNSPSADPLLFHCGIFVGGLLAVFQPWERIVLAELISTEPWPCFSMDSVNVWLAVSSTTLSGYVYVFWPATPRSVMAYFSTECLIWGEGCNVMKEQNGLEGILRSSSSRTSAMGRDISH